MIEHISDSEQEFDVLPLESISAPKVRDRIGRLPTQLQQQVSLRLNNSIYRALLHEEDENTVEEREFQQALLTIQPVPQENTTGRRGLRKRKFASTHPYLADQAHWLDLASIDYLNDIYEDNQDLETMLKFLNQRYIKLKNRYPKEDRYKSKSFFTFLGRSNPNAMNGSLSQVDPNVIALSQVDPTIVEQEQRDTNFSDDGSDDAIGKSRHKNLLIEDSDDESEKGFDSDSSVSLVDLSIIRPSTYTTREESNPLGVSESDSDSQLNSGEAEETIVRVGGRVRRQKNILKGVLPESAKRLDIWTGKKRAFTSAGLRKYDSEKRKVLATKKRNIGTHKNFQSELDLYNEIFVNDDMVDEPEPISEYLHAQNQRTLDDIQQVATASHMFDNRYSNYYSVSESDSEVENDRDLELFKVSTSRGGSPPITDKKPNEHRVPSFSRSVSNVHHKGGKASSGQSHFRERSEINPDFVRPSNKPLKDVLTGKPDSGKLKKGLRKVNSSKVLQRRSFKNTRTPFPRQQSSSYSNSFHHVDPTKGREGPDDDKEENRKKTKIQQYYELPPLSNYSKAPIRFTHIFEAESANKFVRQHKLNQFVSRQHSSSLSDPLFKVDVRRLHLINEGYLSIDINELLVTHVHGQRYAFNLVIKLESQKEAITLLQKIYKSSPDPEITKSIKVLVYWYLTLQEPPSESEFKLLKHIIRLSMKKSDSNGSLDYLASLVCLNYIFLQLSKRFKQETPEMEANFRESCGIYWFEMFEQIHNDIDSEISLETDRYFDFIWMLLSNQPSYFWNILNSQLAKFPSDRPNVYLEGLFYVANKLDSKYFNWEGFYSIYDMVKETVSSVFHKDFLDVCFLLNQRKSWPLEEKLIIKVYSTVANLRFFNFEDEGLNITIFPKIYTFNDIPCSTFFERFMGFLYNYISSLPTVNACKRTVTKLLTSSHYHYENTKRHQNAFCNRFNFIILLCQLSNLNQTNQVNSLVELIIDSENTDIYLLAIKQLGVLSEIMNSKDQELPLESFKMILNKTSHLYLTVPGISKVLIQLSTCLKHSFKLDFFSSSTSLALRFLKLMEELPLKDLKDDVSIRMLDLISIASRIIVHSKETFPPDRITTLERNVNNVRSFASQRMGGFPTKTRIRETRLIGAIENCLKIWVVLTSKIDSNWNKLIFQEFPYMGNSYLRDKFILNFFCNILEYDNLQQHMGTIIDTLLKLFSKFHTSRYVADIINILKKQNSHITDFKAINLNISISEIELNTNRTQIVLAILNNITSYTGLNQMKTRTFVTFLECLNEEYDKYFKSSAYVEYCKKIMNFLQVHWPEMVQQALYQEMANKLGITPMSFNQLKWKSLPRLEKLSFLHKEFISSIFYEKDVFETLDQYTDSENLYVIFHLVSIYMKCIAGNQSEFWLLVSKLMDFLVSKLEDFKIDIGNREFAKFLMLLKEMTGLCFSRWSNRFSNVLTNYQLKSICQTYVILRNAYFIYEGYKDQDHIIEIIKDQLLDFTLPATNHLSTLQSPYSSFNFYDISTNKQEVLNIMEPHLLKPEVEKYHPEEQLGLLKLLVDSKPSQEILEFDLEF